ncbi:MULTISPECIES: polysaccharide biosynthesis protein [Rhizobium]|jgi:FlaA1/EpsC-like NDP-sugar epimerase|uniref:NDP-sugar epimerase, includes UDP-GlcNAc-inverting 4,6-dehydratase FlaA1 and capsular polysaccharide biosynthesis protein EpsC n=1 Tax=Rhizobium lusitanum TaxID=293958 RepID=A0A1C3WY61_9HYPH|nr:MULTISPECIES: nucleoside-diphosphate sugar epimerase/dehydratase [Rhizobium]NKJ04886.1 FlaA1/EpsC-like NDP-sugar epimerase [Rhizobium sp. SG741]NKJ36313.1 FlaA1/EpsC-like NDP-sugar epimerase [Rhizobium sp. SG570]NTJ05627.1 polysaccharide biosynthesis protein [Rhizobium lusitanum]SCB44928.1 NDP-sugar epimerase, includes UDP-GlcNAc-inverting 4,6-dehydratase FlaA1 and capsular polysaccharide biosynthesis protein EpsC [Rhizobium lusitanum]
MVPADKLVLPFLALPRSTKRALALLVDASLCVLTVWFAYCLRLDDWVILQGVEWLPAIVSLLVAIPIFIVLGLYRAIFRYAGLSAFVTVLKAVAIYALAFMTIFTAISVPGVPRTVGILQPLLLLIAIGLSRMWTRYWLGNAYQRLLNRNQLAKVLIYGAGASGRQLAGALANSAELNVVGYLDDDRNLQGSIMGGLPIYDPTDLPALAVTSEIKGVLLALPNATRQRRNEILEDMRKARVTVRTMPDLTALAQGRVAVSDLRELDIEDLLGRNVIVPDRALIEKNIRGKVVMVTGAGGSIGSELCRQILKNGPSSLLLVEQNEFGLYAIHGELEKSAASAEPADVRIIPFLASVRDGQRIRQIMEAWRPKTVYHAAAYKHVPLVEYNPAEGIRNNVLGTLITAQAARDYGVDDFVLISTDKAVRPTNIMGASKRLAEMVLQAMDAGRKPGVASTNFSMVRFGNVLGSSGSVVPLFRQQIRDGGPITLTHPDITRYFMTIPEASQLVIQAGAMSGGGDVFLLDMGEPVRIADLARRMVELSGLTVRDEDEPDGDIELEITGLRPGEKLFEELLIGDNPQPTSHPRIMQAKEDFLAWPELSKRLTALEAALDENDIPLARTMLQKLVSGYAPSSEVVDLVYRERETDLAVVQPNLDNVAPL